MWRSTPFQFIPNPHGVCADFLHLSSSPNILVDPRNGFLLLPSSLEELGPQGPRVFFSTQSVKEKMWSFHCMTVSGLFIPNVN